MRIRRFRALRAIRILENTKGTKSSKVYIDPEHYSKGSGCCIAILDPFRATKITKQSKKTSPWVSCIALDTSENWLACGSGGGCLTLWSLPGMDAIIRIAICAPPQDLVIANNQVDCCSWSSTFTLSLQL